ncbi:response regulator [Niastella populi]|uniref:response regulator n=1 Tax=Niastella populi TaxID=550983 RepID=UPI0009BF121E
MDDDPDDCFIFGTAIRDLGLIIEVFFEMESESAIKRLEHGHIPIPGLLVLDWNMPKVSGSNCLTAIRKLPRYSSVPIVVITTSIASHDLLEATLLGASYSFTKPSSIPGLRDLLRHIFSLIYQANKS